MGDDEIKSSEEIRRRGGVMTQEKGERPDCLGCGRAAYRGRYTGSIPRKDFERGCAALTAMFAVMMAFVTLWEVIVG